MGLPVVDRREKIPLAAITSSGEQIMMREFRDFDKWVDALLDDWDEEYYRAIFDVHCNIRTLLRGQEQKPFSLYYKFVSQDGPDGKEYHFVEEYYGSTLIVRAEQLGELEEYLSKRFSVGANTPENWDAWCGKAHEWCREIRSDWTTD
jgi:hypothetical protein